MFDDYTLFAILCQILRPVISQFFLPFLITAKVISFERF